MEAPRQISIVRRSVLFDAAWYLARDPALVAAGIDPAAHYVTIGAHKGRDPGPQFDTAAYLQACPTARGSALVPLVHFLLLGREKDLNAAPDWQRDPERRRLHALQMALLTQGFTKAPLADLAILSKDAEHSEVRSAAAFEIAQWFARMHQPEDALDWLARAQSIGPIPTGLRRQMAVFAIVAQCRLGDYAGARLGYVSSLEARLDSVDLHLVRANAEPTPEARLPWINRVLSHAGLSELTLTHGKRPAFDRLDVSHPPAAITDGPLVSIIIAAHSAEETLPTAIRSLCDQSWRNLEILVVDDASPTTATAELVHSLAQRDERIRFFRMPHNGGAYAARNMGLRMATGAYVTLLDADDWAHPDKIAGQMRFLRDNPGRIGCMSQAARISPDLIFTRWSAGIGAVGVLRENMSSFLSPLQAVLDRVGPWDRVRFGADGERIRRIRSVYGEGAVVTIDSGLVGLSRIHDSSAVGNSATGIDGFLFGSREEYRQAFDHAHRRGRLSLAQKEPLGPAYPVPAILHRQDGDAGHFDVILASDFRGLCGGLSACIDEIAANRALGLRTGIVSLSTYGAGPASIEIAPPLRGFIDGTNVAMIVAGETASCDLLIVRHAPVLQHPQRYVPRIRPNRVCVVLNSPPKGMPDDPATGYDPQTCARVLHDMTGPVPTLWYPSNPDLRTALGQPPGLAIAPQDWLDCLLPDPNWGQEVRPESDPQTLRIGRHGQDHPSRFPATASDILAVYPQAPGIEVQFHGGAASALRLLNRRPLTWRSLSVWDTPPENFLAGLDVFIDFPQPHAFSSYGRCVLEALRSGTPAILPLGLRSRFGDAALYAEPGNVVTLAQELKHNPVFRQAQINRGYTFLARHHALDTYRTQLGI